MSKEEPVRDGANSRCGVACGAVRISAGHHQAQRTEEEGPNGRASHEERRLSGRRDSEEDQKVVWAQRARQGELDNAVAEFRIVTNLEEKRCMQHLERLSQGSVTRIAEAW